MNGWSAGTAIGSPAVATGRGSARWSWSATALGSSKDSPMVQALDRTLPAHGMGVYSFDFPAHGKSPAGPESLRVPFCMDDLLEGGGPPPGPGSGGGDRLLRLQLRGLYHPPPPGPAAPAPGPGPGLYVYLFLRSAAVTMPALVARLAGQPGSGRPGPPGVFRPPARLTSGRCASPQRSWPTWRSTTSSPATARGAPGWPMVHGGRDDVAPTAAARRFATRFGAR